MIFFNWAGLGMAILGFAIGALSGSIFGEKSLFLVSGLIMVVADLIYRNRRKGPLESTPLFHPKKGGNIMFIPVWIIGAFLFIVGFTV
jgi:hypothetical protein